MVERLRPVVASTAGRRRWISFFIILISDGPRSQLRRRSVSATMRQGLDKQVRPYLGCLVASNRRGSFFCPVCNQDIPVVSECSSTEKLYVSVDERWRSGPLRASLRKQLKWQDIYRAALYPVVRLPRRSTASVRFESVLRRLQIGTEPNSPSVSAASRTSQTWHRPPLLCP